MIRRRLIPLGGITLVILLTYWLINTRLITDVIAPFIYAILLTIGSAINSLPQFLVWVVFMFIVVQLLTSGLIGFARTMNSKMSREVSVEPERTFSLIQKYQRWIEGTHQGVYFRWRIADRLISVVNDVIGETGTRTRPQLEQQLRSNAYHLPADIQQYLIEGLDARNNTEAAPNRLQTLLNSTQASNYRDLERVLTYLESELEIHNAFDNTA